MIKQGDLVTVKRLCDINHDDLLDPDDLESGWCYGIDEETLNYLNETGPHIVRAVEGGNYVKLCGETLVFLTGMLELYDAVELPDESPDVMFNNLLGVTVC